MTGISEAYQYFLHSVSHSGLLFRVLFLFFVFFCGGDLFMDGMCMAIVKLGILNNHFHH